MELRHVTLFALAIFLGAVLPPELSAQGSDGCLLCGEGPGSPIHRPGAPGGHPFARRPRCDVGLRLSGGASLRVGMLTGMFKTDFVEDHLEKARLTSASYAISETWASPNPRERDSATFEYLTTLEWNANLVGSGVWVVKIASLETAGIRWRRPTGEIVTEWFALHRTDPFDGGLTINGEERLVATPVSRRTASRAQLVKAIQDRMLLRGVGSPVDDFNQPIAAELAPGDFLYVKMAEIRGFMSDGAQCAADGPKAIKARTQLARAGSSVVVAHLFQNMTRNTGMDLGLLVLFRSP